MKNAPACYAKGDNYMIQEDRALWKYIVFGILTCGIYNFYFIYKMAQDVNVMCADDGKKTSGLVVFILLSYLTCGIYPLIWYYSLGNRLAENAPRYGLNFQENGTTVLLWHIFGMLLCGIGAYIAMNILIQNTNAMAKAYNGHTNPNGPGPVGGQQPAPKVQAAISGQKTSWIPQKQEAQENSALPQNTGFQATPSVGYTESETTVLNMGQTVTQPRGILYFVGTQESVTIDKDEFRIGKNGEMSDYVIRNNTSVSRQHAVIQRSNGQFYVTDLGSTNGTFVNDKRISGTVQLQDGDNIRYADEISVFNILRGN